jgi:hybrid cluster-associated redox disulfide protein
MMFMVEKDWLITRVLEETGMEGATLMAETGLHCVGCLAARGESLEAGCKAHGLTDGQVDALVAKLNALKK